MGAAISKCSFSQCLWELLLLKSQFCLGSTSAPHSSKFLFFYLKSFDQVGYDNEKLQGVINYAMKENKL